MENFNPTIVTLGPSFAIDRVLTFDEATEGYSNAKGKGRARKAKRQADKRQKKKTKKLGRINDRNEVKSARTGNRQQRRLNKVGGKNVIKSTRKSNRFQRRAIGDNDNPLNDGEGLLEEDLNNAPDIEESAPAEPSTTADQVEESGENWGGAQPPEEEEAEEVYEEEAPEEEEAEEEYEQEQDDEDPSSFDGIMGAEDRFSEFADGKEDTIPVPDAVLVTATNAEWNKEMLARIKDPKYRPKELTTEQDVKDAMDNCRTRIYELTSALDGYAQCKGDFKDNRYEAFPLIDMMYSDADGSKANEKSKRTRQVKKAIQAARKKRAAITIVKTTLNPIINKQRIEVPASSNFDAEINPEFETKDPTGLNGLDNINDSDAPDIRTIELSSNMAGSLKNVNWKGVIIGVAIAGGLIYAAKKYKVI